MLPVWNRPQDQTQLLLQIKISIHWCAMLSKKKSVLILRKSKKGNATASLVFTAKFTPQSASDIFVIKLGRHACLDKAIWHAVWQAPERGYGPGWPEVLPPSLTRPADGCFGLNANALWNLWSRVLDHGRQPPNLAILASFWIRFKCIVTKRKSAFLLTLTYYSDATVIPAGISSYFPESLFITAPF